MAYSILVRRIDAFRSQAEPLATDIGSLELAGRLAQGIAGSYPTHGRDAARATFWFVNRLGLHELLVAPTKEERGAGTTSRQRQHAAPVRSNLGGTSGRSVPRYTAPQGRP